MTRTVMDAALDVEMAPECSFLNPPVGGFLLVCLDGRGVAGRPRRPLQGVLVTRTPVSRHAGYPAITFDAVDCPVECIENDQRRRVPRPEGSDRSQGRKVGPATRRCMISAAEHRPHIM